MVNHSKALSFCAAAILAGILIFVYVVPTAKDSAFVVTLILAIILVGAGGFFLYLILRQP